MANVFWKSWSSGKRRKTLESARLCIVYGRAHFDYLRRSKGVHSKTLPWGNHGHLTKILEIFQTYSISRYRILFISLNHESHLTYFWKWEFVLNDQICLQGLVKFCRPNQRWRREVQFEALSIQRLKNFSSQRSVDGEHLKCFQSENAVFKSLRRGLKGQKFGPSEISSNCRGC